MTGVPIKRENSGTHTYEVNAVSSRGLPEARRKDWNRLSPSTFRRILAPWPLGLTSGLQNCCVSPSVCIALLRNSQLTSITPFTCSGRKPTSASPVRRQAHPLTKRGEAWNLEKQLILTSLLGRACLGLKFYSSANWVGFVFLESFHWPTPKGSMT